MPQPRPNHVCIEQIIRIFSNSNEARANSKSEALGHDPFGRQLPFMLAKIYRWGGSIPGMIADSGTNSQGFCLQHLPVFSIQNYI